MKVLMIIPAYNEAMNLVAVVDDIKENFKDADILIVNDCSQDNTLEVIQKIEGINFIDLPINLGYSYAVQTGLKYAAQENYDYLIQFDGDGQHLASEAKKMYDYSLEKNVDIVIGSRFLSETDYQHSFFRKIGTTLFQKIIKRLTGKHISDPTSGLQVIKRNVFIPLSKIHAYPEFPDANLLIQLIYQGVTIDEISVKMKNREFGESMHGGVIKPIKYMLKMFYYIVMVYFDNLSGKGKKK
ncbi:MAG: glycosyltransferase family 2 protein [Eubacteriaceae bacterium]|nr:glycosyltransferase family 2 protein [Eubacteriaceae bacterium]